MDVKSPNPTTPRSVEAIREQHSDAIALEARLTHKTHLAVREILSNYILDVGILLDRIEGVRAQMRDPRTAEEDRGA